MDFCILEVPLDTSIQKDRLKLNKGSLSKRRKPSRYALREQQQSTAFRKHVTTVQITAKKPQPTTTTTVSLGKRELRRRAHSESRLNGCKDTETPNDLKKTTEVKKSNVLIQTWERRSQSDLKKVSHEKNNRFCNGDTSSSSVNNHILKHSGKENRQSWKPVHNMPDPITFCTSEKEKMRNKYNGCNNGYVHNKGSTVSSNRLIRPKSMCAINGSSNEEPEWISLSRKLCAKFVQSHLDTDSLANGETEKEPQKPVPCKKHNETSNKETKPVTNGIPKIPTKSGPPQWINLSRKLCNKFIEDHITSEPLPRTKSVEEIKCNMQIKCKNSENRRIESKNEPEWIHLSRRLRAKFIEGHKDDPDTISLDNQLNASDLEDYCLDMKSKPKINPPPQETIIHQKSLPTQKAQGNFRETLTLEKDFNQVTKHPSQTSYCYWSEINPGEKEIRESRGKSSPALNGVSTHSVAKDKNQLRSSYVNTDVQSCRVNKKSERVKSGDSNGDSKGRTPYSYSNSHDYDSLQINNCSAAIKSHQIMREDFEFSDKIENPKINCESDQNNDDDVNYELTFETFETADDEIENDPVEQLANEVEKPSTFNGNKLQSKSLCDLTHYQPDSLECGLEFNDSECSSLNSLCEEQMIRENSSTSNNVARNYSDNDVMYENIARITSKSEYLVEVNGCNKSSFAEDNESFVTSRQCDSFMKPSNDSNNGGRYQYDEVQNVHDIIDADLKPAIRSLNTSKVAEMNGCDVQREIQELSKIDSKDCANGLEKKDKRTSHLGKNEKSRQNRRSAATQSNGDESSVGGDSFAVKYEESHTHRFFVRAISDNGINSTEKQSLVNCNEDKTDLSRINQSICTEEISKVKKSSTSYDLSRMKSGSTKDPKPNSRDVTRENEITLEDRTSLKEEKTSFLSNGEIKIPKHTYIAMQEHRSVDLLEFHPGTNKKKIVSERINGKRESLKEFDVENESYQSINPPFEFDAFEMPAICSPENRRVLKSQEREVKRDRMEAYSNAKRKESSDSETPNSTPFDSRTLVSPSSCASDSDTSSWTLTKTNSYGRRNHNSLHDTDFSDCSLSVKYNDTPSCSNQSTMESCKSSRQPIAESTRKNKNPTNRYSEVFVDCETSKNWKKTRSLDNLEANPPTDVQSNVYANIQEDLQKTPIAKSDDNIDSTSAMPESLRHLFNLPRTHIYTPTAKTSLLLSKSSEPLPCHYYSSPPLSTFKKESSFSSKPKTERSSSIKIKDIAQGIMLTFRKFHSHSKSSQLSASQYVDVSHLAESSVGHKDFCPEKHQVRVGQDIQRLNSTEYGKIASRRISAGYFGHRSTSESNLHLQSASQLCTCKELPSKKTKEEDRPKSFNFGLIAEAKRSKSNKKTPEMKEKKSKSHNGKSRGKKLEQRSGSSVSRKIQQMADGTLCLVTTVSGDTAVPGVYSDSQDTSSEISTHAPVKQSGESNC